LIRSAAMEDVAGITPLVESYWEFESIRGFDRTRVESLLRGLLSEPQRGACWVAQADGRLHGYLLAVFMFSLEHGGLMAEIDELFVSSDLRSLGTGSRLLEWAERDLAERGLVRLQLQLGVDNDRASLFYERHGFFRRASYQLLDKPLRVRPMHGRGK
jgi:GNAT superfamily N-acetyltransferase